MLEKKNSYHQGKEFVLNKNDPLLFFIQRIRDEAHRFAISTHRAKRKKKFKQVASIKFKVLKAKKKSSIKPLWIS